ncbi:MAG: DUF4159 domain-containing protein [Planctomycetota bacterium]
MNDSRFDEYQSRPQFLPVIRYTLVILLFWAICSQIFAAQSIDDLAVKRYQPCRCDGGSMELTLVIDTTGSMAKLLETCKAQTSKIVELAAARHQTFRLGVVAFRTSDDRDYTTNVLPLTADIQQATRFLNGLEAKGGGEEITDIALQMAADELHWTPGARKVILLIGDEDVMPKRRYAFLDAALAAKARGIIIHTLTASETAWMYWRNLHQNEARDYLQQYGNAGVERFVLPDYAEASRITGGMSRGATDAGDFLRWLLAVALQRESDADRLDVESFTRWTASGSATGTNASRGGLAAAPAGPPPDQPALIAELRDDAEWTATHQYGALFDAIEKQSVIERPAAIEIVDSRTTDINERAGILYFSTCRAPAFSPQRIKALREFIESGGVIWADNCCCSPEFHQAMAGLSSALTGSELRAIESTHPLFDCAYDIDAGIIQSPLVWMARPSGDTRPGALDTDHSREGGNPSSSGIARPGALIYTPYDLGASWPDSLPGDSAPLDRLLARQLSANIVIWSIMQR